MPRHNPGVAGFTGGACKIRKRGSSSSSSASSSVLHNYRFKRAIMAGKRGGSTTPVPNWRMYTKSPSSDSRISESSRYNGTQQGPVSARKLANALWELNKIPSPQFTKDLPIQRSKKMPRSLPHHLSDPSHSPVSESSSQRRMMLIISQRVRCNEHNYRSSGFLSNASLMEVDACSQGLTPTSSPIGAKSHLKELRNGLTTAKELLKLLSRIWGLEDQHSCGISLVSALRVELDRARVQVHHLIQEQRLDHNEISCLKKRFLKEKSSWKSKEQERIKAAVHSIVDELETEKILRRRAERLNKKLGLELANTRAILSRVVKEVKNERRSRGIIEQVCNEIVRGVGEDKAEVEQLKREASKVREELEKEREMLQLADEWREERVQMKLMEAKVQFEEKNAAVDQLRNELEAFLEIKRTSEESPLEERGEVEDGEVKEEEDDEGDSVESDLHSIELNMESNNKGNIWSYATKDDVAEAKLLASVEERSEGKGTFQHLGGDLDQGRLSESSSLLNKQALKLDQDAERYISVKELRDQMLAGTRVVLPRGLASPTRQWNRSQALQETGNGVCEGLNVAEIVKAVRESRSKARLVGNNSDSVPS